MPELTEAAAKLGGIYFVPAIKSEDDPAKKYLKEKAPFWDVIPIKAGSVPVVNNDTYVAALPFMLSMYKDFSEEAVYQITKALWQYADELTPIHPLLKNWKKAMVYEGAIFPYHPGAVRFYKEAGVWTDQIENIQKKLLSQL